MSTQDTFRDDELLHVSEAFAELYAMYMYWRKGGGKVPSVGKERTYRTLNPTNVLRNGYVKVGGNHTIRAVVPLVNVKLIWRFNNASNHSIRMYDKEIYC